MEELVEHFLAGGNTAELKKDVLKGNRPDYISPLDDLAFDIYQVNDLFHVCPSFFQID